MTGPLLAALLRRAVPDLRVLDLAVGYGGLWPWWPEAMIALPARPGPAEDLLAAFGLGPPDPALAAGLASSWGGEGPRLVVTDGAATGWLGGGTWVLTRAAVPPGMPRLLLLLGCGGDVQQWQLLLPEAAMPGVLDALAGAAAAVAAPGWSWGARAVTGRLATLTLIGTWHRPDPCTLPGATLPQRREAPGRLRALLGVLPPQPVRIRVVAEGATALLLDGAPHAADSVFTPSRGEPVVLGLAGPEARLLSVGIAAA